MKKPAGRPVLVTTQFNGVFFGYAEKTDGDPIHLTRARLCVYWSAEMHGFMGLASIGPSSSCRIGPPADIELRRVTSITEVSPEAVDKWEKAPWAD